MNKDKRKINKKVQKRIKWQRTDQIDQRFVLSIFFFFSRERSSYPAAGITSIITQRERTICTISDTVSLFHVGTRAEENSSRIIIYIHFLFSPKKERKKGEEKRTRFTFYRRSCTEDRLFAHCSIIKSRSGGIDCGE